MEFIMGHYFAYTLALAIITMVWVRFTTCHLGHAWRFTAKHYRDGYTVTEVKCKKCKKVELREGY